MYGFAAGLANSLILLFKIIAYQNERSGFITLLAYVGLIYAFLGDTFLFGEKFGALEIIGVTIIFLLNLALIFYKMRASTPSAVSSQATSSASDR